MSEHKKTKNIDLSKRYKFPHEIKIVRYLGKILVIAVDTANWLVLENDNQLNFLYLLREMTLGDALNEFRDDSDNARYVVTQLEARRFENTEVLAKNQTVAMHLYLTNECNMRCPHCYIHAGKAKENELSTDEIFTLLDNFKIHGGEIVTLSGGEIHTRHDLIGIIYHANSLGLKVELLTNGTLWTENEIQKIAPLIYRVQISIDGYSEESNAKVRGKGSLRKSLDTLDCFIRYGATAEVGITPWFDENLPKDLEKYAEFGKRLLREYSDRPFTVKYNGNLLDGRNIKVSSSEKKKYERLINQITEMCYGDVLDIPFIEFHKRFGIENNCDYGNLSVSSTGDVFMCAAIPLETPVANIRDVNFKTIWNISQKAKEQSDITNLNPCRECELKYICGGDCRIIYFEELKNWNSKQIDTHPKRFCNKKLKDTIYDLMIRTNKELYV